MFQLIHIYIIVNHINFSCNVDIILILQHSFYLTQQKILQPTASAIQRYNASGISTRVAMALKDVFKQYYKISEQEKVDMILNVIVQNFMGELNTCLICIYQQLHFRDSSS